jgi:hypothetical protein
MPWQEMKTPHPLPVDHVSFAFQPPVADANRPASLPCAEAQPAANMEVSHDFTLDDTVGYEPICFSDLVPGVPQAVQFGDRSACWLVR